MVGFFVKRFLGSTIVVLLSTFIMYFLVSLSIDPLGDLRTSTAPNKADLIAKRVAQLHLDESVLTRYFNWLKGAAGCLVGNCELGVNWQTGRPVSALLGGAIANTLLLVTFASFLAIILGCMVGLISALRQYTGFDYSVTFMSFLLYSLPVFWVAVLAKVFLAIKFNDFLAHPSIPIWAVVLFTALAALAVSSGVGGRRNQRLISAGIAGLATAAALIYFNVTDWFTDPGFGIVIVALMSAGIAVVMTVLSTGLRNRRALGAALTVAGIGVVIYYPMLYFWNAVDASWLLMLGLAVVSVLVGVGVGYAWGGPDKAQSGRTAGLTAILVASLLFVDRALQSWQAYTNSPLIKGRPIATIDAQTPNLQGSFWITTIDHFTHLALPSLTLILISFAGYTRYSRASMLEVLTQDYIRTARSKGLTERTVIMRHAFRNALLPLASVVPVDIITLVGGAVLTETVFGWSGMGLLFVHGLQGSQQDTVMAYLLIVGILAVVANFVADLIYAVLDPRIRVSA